jgi:hypothetical protein
MRGRKETNTKLKEIEIERKAVQVNTDKINFLKKKRSTDRKYNKGRRLK